MMLSIHFRRPHSFAVFAILGLSIPSKVISTEVPLTQVGLWDSMDTCAQSCAISASSAFSSLASCSASDPACICNVPPAVSAVAGAAHQCASISCTAFPSYADDAERARGALTSYCFSNGIRTAGTTLKAQVTPSSTTSTSLSTSLDPPSTQFSSTNSQPSSSPSMMTLASSPSLPTNPTTAPTTTSVQPTLPTTADIQPAISSSAPQSRWMHTKIGKGVIGGAVTLAVILIILNCWIFRKALRKQMSQLAVKLGLRKRLESSGSSNSNGKVVAFELPERRETEQRVESAGRSKDQPEPTERSDGRQDDNSLNVPRNILRSSLHPEPVHITTKNGQTYDSFAILDSGSSDHFIHSKLLSDLGYNEDLKPLNDTFRAAGNDNLSTLGSIELTWTTKNGKKTRRTEFYVFEGTSTKLVLSKAFAFEEGLLLHDRTAWALERNDKPMSPEERDALRQASEHNAQQAYANRNIQWLYEDVGGIRRWYYIDAAGRKVYRDQVGGAMGGSGGPAGGGPMGGNWAAGPSRFSG